MSDKQMFVLLNAQIRQRAAQAVLEANEGFAVRITPPTRNLEQNSAQWPILEALSQQVQWPVNGVMTTLTDEEWKDVLTAAFEQDTKPRLAAGLDGGVVMLGRRTKEFSKAKFSEWLDFLNAVAATKGVNL